MLPCPSFVNYDVGVYAGIIVDVDVVKLFVLCIIKGSIKRHC